MIVVLVSGGLAFVVGLLILRPVSLTGGRAQAGAATEDDGRRRELLRQLRDLDDDLAAGKLTQDDHVRLRGPVEREAATGLVTAVADPPASLNDQEGSVRQDVAGGRLRWRRRAGVLLALAGAATGVTFLLISTVSARTAGQAITGESVPGAPAATTSPSGSAAASQPGGKSPTTSQLAAVAAAQARVELNPKNVNAHLALAGAYTAAGSSQLATVEYLAVTRLDPTNPEANTSLALLAFEVGHAAQGKAMVDRVLKANPDYAEALYVRGVINLIGLRRRAAGEHDLNAYLAAAPFGSHRTAAATLLALAKIQGHR